MLTSIMTFISSAKSTYILLALMLLAGIYLWFDYQSKVEKIGALEQSIEIASKGVRDAIELNNVNVSNFDKERKDFKEVLNALQELHKKNRELEISLSKTKSDFDTFKNNADVDTKKCLQMELPNNVFGGLVSGNITPDKLLIDKAD